MRLTLQVNGECARGRRVWEGESLLYVLRERLGLPGSKNACEQGECGSCSVYLDGELVCSCLVAGRARPRAARSCTVEGLADGRRAPPGPAGVRRDRRRAVRLLHAGPDRGDPRPAAAHAVARRDPEIREALAGNLCRCTGLREDPRRRAPRGRRRSARHERRSSSRAARSPRWTPPAPSIADGPDPDRGRPASPPSAPARRPSVAAPAPPRSTARGCLATPGLVNCHHHLYQWATRGLRAGGDALRLAHRRCTRCGRGIDEEIVHAAAPRRRWPRWPCSGCTHLHRPPLRVPARRRRPARRARSTRPRGLGLRFHPCRGSMDLGALARRPAARRGRRGPRRDPRRHRGGDRPLPRPGARARCCGSRVAPVLAVLGHRAS